MIIAPIGIIKLYDYIATVLILLGMPEKFAGHIIFDTSIILFYFYFIGPYVFSTLNYKNSSAVVFSKLILNDGNYAVYESPIMPFLQGCPLGMAHKGKIFVNSFISKNQNILSYVIAHEKGHIEDHYNNIMRNFFSPVIFPWVVYISVLIVDYLHFIGKLHYTFWTMIIAAVSVICLILIIFIQIEQKCQQRADEFAIRKIGIDNAIKALQELAYGDTLLPEKYKYKYRSQAIKLIQRLKQK
ncbi:M48 family metalloprotease [Thermoanaerobacterium sp. RBIITD]|uniref:M48 family metalloprotease n=1 Tax=Thermoanaerobacterium sp. RBIITD TaxID=1550240 RepID=UPI001561271F|nr:M48 family metalloprotease [Thermoanaerobacterium sp. RBIITD]